LLTGWFLSPLIVKELMAVDITQYYSFEINGIIITSINESIPQVAESFLPEITGLITPTSPAYLLIHSTLSMTLRIVVMIIWLILMGTIFRFIFWIIYRIIRPKAKTKNGKKVGKGLFSRPSCFDFNSPLQYSSFGINLNRTFISSDVTGRRRCIFGRGQRNYGNI
jgi:hypothetical protein